MIRRLVAAIAGCVLASLVPSALLAQECDGPKSGTGTAQPWTLLVDGAERSHHNNIVTATRAMRDSAVARPGVEATIVGAFVMTCEAVPPADTVPTPPPDTIPEQPADTIAGLAPPANVRGWADWGTAGGELTATFAWDAVGAGSYALHVGYANIEWARDTTLTGTLVVVDVWDVHAGRTAEGCVRAVYPAGESEAACTSFALPSEPSAIDSFVIVPDSIAAAPGVLAVSAVRRTTDSVTLRLDWDPFATIYHVALARVNIPEAVLLGSRTLAAPPALFTIAARPEGLNCCPVVEGGAVYDGSWGAVYPDGPYQQLLTATLWGSIVGDSAADLRASVRRVVSYAP